MMTNPFSEKVLATSPPLHKAGGQSKKNRPSDQVPFAETLTKEINGRSASSQHKASIERINKHAEDHQASSRTDVISSTEEEIKIPNLERNGGNKELNNTNEVVALGISPKQLSDEQQETEKLTAAIQEAASEQDASQSWKVLLSVIGNSDGGKNGTIAMEKSLNVPFVGETIPIIQNQSAEPDRLAEALINQQQIAESQRNLSASQGVVNEKELSGLLAEAESQRILSASQGVGNEKELNGLLAEAESQNVTAHGTKSSEQALEDAKNSKGTGNTLVSNLPSSHPEAASSQNYSRSLDSLANFFNQQGSKTNAAHQTLIEGMKASGGQQRISIPQTEIDEVKLNSLNIVMSAADEQAIQAVLNKGAEGIQLTSTADNNSSLEQAGTSKKESGLVLQKLSDTGENDIVQHSIPQTQLNQSLMVENKSKAHEAHTAASIFQQTITNLETLLKGDQKFLRIQLYPENLGGLEIKLSSQGGALQISILADNAIAQQALERHAQELQQVLQQSGVNLTGLTINQRQAQQGTEQQNASHRKQHSQARIQQSDDENIQEVVSAYPTAYNALGSTRVDFLV